MLRRFPARVSLRWKLPAVVCALVLVVVAALSGSAYYAVRRAVDAAAGARLQTVVSQLVTSLDMSRRQMAGRVRASAREPRLARYLASPGNATRAAALGALPYDGPNPDQVVAVQLWDSTGRLVLSTGSDTTLVAGHSPAAAIEEIGPRDTAVVGLFQANGDSVVYPSAAAVMNGKTRLGYLVQWRRLGTTPQAQKQIADLIGTGAALYLGNATGPVWTDLGRIVPRPPLPASLKGILRYERPGSGQQLAAAAPVGQHWLLVMEFPHALVLAPAHSFLRQLLLIASALLVLGLIGSWALSRRLTAPLGELTEAAAAIAAADYTRRVKVDGEDELGKLAQSFNEMAERVAKSEREREERFRLVVTSIRDYAIYMLDPAGRVMTWNHGAERLKRYAAEDIVGQSFAKFFTPEDQHRPRELLDTATRNGTAEDEGWQVRKDGSKFWGSSLLTALRDDYGTLVGFAKVTRDTTQQREAEAALKRSNAALESFSYSVAHDLRAPLRAINGFSQALLEDHGEHLPQEGKDLMQTVLNSTARMGQMIEGLLSFSRLGQKEMEITPVDLKALAEAAVSEQKAGDGTRPVEIVIQEVPLVRGDRVLLRQVMGNLVANAFKFSRHRDRPRIEIGGAVQNGETIVQVRDNGVGFDMKYADKLFGVFQRLHSQEEFEGNGVGLALVRRIIERHGGRVWAESVPGTGTTFYFSIPNRS